MLMQEAELGFELCWQHVLLYSPSVPLLSSHKLLYGGGCGATLRFKVSNCKTEILLCLLQLTAV
jgi:hypothetical protein